MFIFGKVNSVEKELSAIKNTNKTILEQLKKYEETKDRVDISLREYESLKDENKKLKEAIHLYEQTIIRLGIPFEAIDHIIPDTLHTYESHLIDHDPLSLRKRMRIEFDVEM